MAEDPPVRIQMKSDPTYLSGAREFVASVSRRLGFPEDVCGKIALALDEALCNVIRHGYACALDKPIWISLGPIGTNGAVEGIRIVLEDEARQIEPDQIRGRDLEDVRPGGLGVHIIREIMDEVLFEKRTSKGMRLTLVKKLPSDDGSPHPDTQRSTCMPEDG